MRRGRDSPEVVIPCRSPAEPLATRRGPWARGGGLGATFRRRMRNQRAECRSIGRGFCLADQALKE
eukprot:9604661-Alexandrium_andersonii.AAC.2